MAAPATFLKHCLKELPTVELAGCLASNLLQDLIEIAAEAQALQAARRSHYSQILQALIA
jgi:hypothetical protein